MKKELVVSRALARSALWRVAAALLRYPDERAEQDLRDAEMWDAAGRAASTMGDPQLSGALGETRGVFERAPTANLEEAYTGLFGHTVRSTVPAYETEWGASQGMLQPHRIADLQAFYRAHGLRPAPGDERPDHVSVECEFLHFLAYKETWATLRGREEEAALCLEASRTFFAEHAGRFVPAFAAGLRRESGMGPYAAVAQYLRALVAREGASLGVRTGEEDLPLRSVSFEEEAGCMSCVARTAAPPPPG